MLLAHMCSNRLETDGNSYSDAKSAGNIPVRYRNIHYAF